MDLLVPERSEIFISLVIFWKVPWLEMAVFTSGSHIPVHFLRFPATAC